MNYQEIYDKYLKYVFNSNYQMNTQLTEEQKLIINLFYIIFLLVFVFIIIIILLLIKNSKLKNEKNFLYNLINNKNRKKQWVTLSSKKKANKDSYITQSNKQNIRYLKLNGNIKKEIVSKGLVEKLLKKYKDNYITQSKTENIAYLKLSGNIEKEIVSKGLVKKLFKKYKDNYITQSNKENIRYLKLNGNVKKEIVSKGVIKQLLKKYNTSNSRTENNKIEICKTNDIKKSRYEIYFEKKKIRELNLYKLIGELYNVRKSLMNQGEQRAFYFLSKILSHNKYKGEFFIFPQVRVIDFVNLTDRADYFKDIDKPFYDLILSSITSKSVDFVICRKLTDKYKVQYIPHLVIELDGNAHRSNDITVYKNDYFKNVLFAKLGLNFVRIPYNNLCELSGYIFENIIIEYIPLNE